MLILVAVTINVALNGGLFEKARTAASQTEQEALYEEIIASTEYTNSGEINVLATYNAFIEGKQVTLKTTGNLSENTKNVVFTVAGKTGDYIYTITTGKIIKGENPWFTRGLTAGYIQYDKKYYWDGVIPYGLSKEQVNFSEGAFVMLKSDGSVNQYFNESDGEEIIYNEQFENIDFNCTNSHTFVTDTTIDFTDENTLTLTIDGYVFTFITK